MCTPQMQYCRPESKSYIKIDDTKTTLMVTL